MWNRQLHRGFRTFLIIWSGQLVSLIGTAMTRFALLLWAYQQTAASGQPATAVALLGFFTYVPYLLVSPFAGVVVDRADRRLVMLGADVSAGVMTLGLLVLSSAGYLDVWHLYVAAALTGACEAFQVPAYTAATSMLVPAPDYGRVNGLRALAESASQVLAPGLASVLLPVVDLGGIMFLDLATVLVAVLTLLCVQVPRPQAATPERSDEGLWRQVSYGFRYIWCRPGLLGLLGIFIGMNFFGTLTYFSILPAMVLARSGNAAGVLATVEAALGLGGVTGGILASVWGGPRRRIHTVLAGAAASFFLGDLLFALGRQVVIWSIAAFLGALFIPLLLSANRSIWQSKVAAAVQGRVFAVQGMGQQVSMPLGYLLAGPLADHVFEPAMRAEGWLRAALGPLVGTGPGAGMAVMFLGTAILGMLMSLSGYLFPAVRHVEDEHHSGETTAPVTRP